MGVLDAWNIIANLHLRDFNLLSKKNDLCVAVVVVFLYCVCGVHLQQLKFVRGHEPIVKNHFFLNAIGPFTFNMMSFIE